jgi:hypothetical protein
MATTGGGRTYERYAWVLLFLVGLVTLVVGSSGAVFGRDVEEQTLVGTFGAGMGIFSLAIILTAYRRGERWAWFVLWYYPIFFIIHIIALGTVIPDLVFLILSVLGLVLPIRKFFARTGVVTR